MYYRYEDCFRHASGKVAAAVSVHYYTDAACTVSAVLFSDAGITPLANPVTTTSEGFAVVYCATKPIYYKATTDTTGHMATCVLGVSPAEISPITAKGDILAYGSAATRLPIGRDGETLLPDVRESLGMKWMRMREPYPSPFAEFMARLKNTQLTPTPFSWQIIGDSTANGTDEWAYLFQQKLAAAYPAWSFYDELWGDVSQGYSSTRRVVQTGTAGDRYLALDGTGVRGTGDSAAISITGDLDVRVKVALDSWSEAAGVERDFAAQFGGAPNRGWRFYFLGSATGGKPSFGWTEDGSTNKDVYFTDATWAPHRPADGAVLWLRVTLDCDDGAGNYVCTLYKSSDGVAWTLIEAKTVAGPTSIANVANDLTAGSRASTAAPGQLMIGKLYRVEVRNGINGNMVACPLPEFWPLSTAGHVPVPGGAPVCTCVNASHPGADIDYLNDVNRFAAMTPAWGQLLTIVNCGHNDGADVGATITAKWDTMLAAIRAKFPLGLVAWTSQNPETAPRTVAQIDDHALRFLQMASWCKRNNVGFIDAYRAFFLDGRALNLLVDADGVHLTADGSALWADEVAASFDWRLV